MIDGEEGDPFLPSEMGFDDFTTEAGIFNLDPTDNDLDDINGILDLGTSDNDGGGDELSALKEELRKKKSEVEDQKFFLNDCDEAMRTQIKDDIALFEKEIEELEEKIRDLEKQDDETKM